MQRVTSENAVRGAFWLLLSTFLMTMVLSIGKWVGGEINPLQITFLRYACGLVTLAILIALRRTPPADLVSIYPRGHLGRAFFGAAGVACSMYAVTHMPIGDASAISLTRGAFTLILAALWLGERVIASHWVASLVCIGGALIIIGMPSNEATPSSEYLISAFSALLGALFISAEVILIKILSIREKTIVILLYVHFFASLFLLIPALYFWNTPTYEQLIALVVLGPIAVSAQYCSVQAFRIANAATLAPIPYSRLIFAAIIGVIIFGEQIGVTLIIGGSLIILGNVGLTYLHSRK